MVKEKDQNVECACDHLTNFAILMQVKEFEVCSLFSVCNNSLENIRNLNPSFKDLLTAVGNPMNDFSDLIIKQIKSAEETQNEGIIKTNFLS